jgi:hypothetical protein
MRAYPRRGEAALLYADELVHRGPLAGIPLDSGLAVMDDAARRERFSTALEHAVVGYARVGDRARADRALALLETAGATSGEEAARRRRLIAFVRSQRFTPRRAALQLRYIRLTADSLTREGLARYVRLGNLFDIPEGQLGFGRMLADRGATAAVRASGHEAQGLALLLLGRPGAALLQIDSAAALFGTPEAELARWEWRALGPALGLPVADPAVRADAVRRLERIAGGSLGARAAWTLATAAQTRGDTAAVARWRRELERADGPVATPLAALAAAADEAARGRLDSALARTAPLLRSDGSGLVRDPFARAILYLRRGDWQLAAGDSTAAERSWLWTDAWDVEGWPQGTAQAGEVDGALAAVARLRRAGLSLAKRGRNGEACRLVARVRQLWSGAEPMLAPLRAVADSHQKVCQ